MVVGLGGGISEGASPRLPLPSRDRQADGGVCESGQKVTNYRGDHLPMRVSGSFH